MDNRKDDAYYIKKMATDLEFIHKHTADISIEELTSNEVLLDSVMSASFRYLKIL